MKSIQVTVRVFLLMLGMTLLLAACGQEQPPYIPPAQQPNYNQQYPYPQPGQGGAQWNTPYGGGQVQWQNGGYVYPQQYRYPQSGGFVQWNGPYTGGTVQWQR